MSGARTLTLFISDLHLEADRPGVTALFQRFLHEYGSRARALYILGDFFEVWIGDDDLSPLARWVVQTLRTLSDQGTEINLMVGNRDFLIGERFAEEAGCRLLDDPTIIDLGGTPTLLMHGDSLCTDDTEYQRFRQQVRGSEWRREFLAQPREIRAAVARDLRRQSRERSKGKPLTIMDVNQGEVESVMRHHGVTRLIHGHTHRPARHRFHLDSTPVERWVLGDWNATAQVLICDADKGMELVEFGAEPHREDLDVSSL
ncbi:MAG: UDP-2,3-diacylglucosamine diphosphatase [Gammaproteobacteria bacterium]